MQAAESGALDAPFWDGLAAGQLRVQRCCDCRNWTWPPQWRCGRCGSWSFEWAAVPMDGVVHSWTYTPRALGKGFDGEAPYVSVLVELPAAGGVRLLGCLDGEESEVVIGDPLTGFVATDPEGPVLRWARSQDGRAG